MKFRAMTLRGSTGLLGRVVVQFAVQARIDRMCRRANLGEIRDTVNRGWPLGSERFKDEIERALFHLRFPDLSISRFLCPTRSMMLQGKPSG